MTPNLIYLCRKHHAIVDKNARIYSVSVLRQMKTDHEDRLRMAGIMAQPKPPVSLVDEVVHSTILRISKLPAFVYSAPCAYTERQKDEVRKQVDYSALPKEELVPFILREDRLFAFHDLGKTDNPFVNVTDPAGRVKIAVEDFYSDPEGRRRLVSLLNSSLAKFCARKQIRFDRDHHRYIFTVVEKGCHRKERYRTLTGRNEDRGVVWNPKKRNTGEARPFWYHLAAGLSFHMLATRQWCMSIRPERHLTTDGETPYNPKYVGRKITSLKARMFNGLFLGEVHFWREFLSGGKPRFFLPFGDQSAAIETELVGLNVRWAGIPEDEKTFTNQSFEEDLFSLAEMKREFDEEDALSWEEDDINESDD